LSGKYISIGQGCSVRISAGKLKVGEEVYLISGDAPIQRVTVKTIELRGEKVAIAKKGEEVGVDFGMKVRSGTDVYVIRKN